VRKATDAVDDIYCYPIPFPLHTPRPAGTCYLQISVGTTTPRLWFLAKCLERLMHFGDLPFLLSHLTHKSIHFKHVYRI